MDKKEELGEDGLGLKEEVGHPRSAGVPVDPFPEIGLESGAMFHLVQKMI